MWDQVLKESKQSLSKEDLPILAIDYGEKRMGLAVSDSNGSVGSPLTIVKNSRRKKIDTVIKEILEVADEYRVNSFLLGVPYAFEEQHTEIQKRIKAFAELLEVKSGKKIYYFTETYSSQEAKSVLKPFVATGTRDGRVDKMSAALFLQNFLDERNKHKPTTGSV